MKLRYLSDACDSSFIQTSSLMHEKKTDKRSQLVGMALGVTYFPVSADQTVTQLPL
jgi:hypothetical protein